MPALGLSFRGAQLKDLVLRLAAGVSQNRTLEMNNQLVRGKTQQR